MFSGMINEIGVVAVSAGPGELVVSAPKVCGRLEPGKSFSVNGVRLRRPLRPCAAVLAAACPG